MDKDTTQHLPAPMTLAQALALALLCIEAVLILDPGPKNGLRAELIEAGQVLEGLKQNGQESNTKKIDTQTN